MQAIHRAVPTRDRGGHTNTEENSTNRALPGHTSMSGSLRGLSPLRAFSRKAQGVVRARKGEWIVREGTRRPHTQHYVSPIRDHSLTVSNSRRFRIKRCAGGPWRPLLWTLEYRADSIFPPPPHRHISRIFRKADQTIFLLFYKAYRAVVSGKKSRVLPRMG